jgi:energy-coupling factor transporter ATP-binding protein EcfA2
LHPDEPATERTLVLVCHHLKTSREVADHFVLLDEQRLVGCPFTRAEWPDRRANFERLFTPLTLREDDRQPP